MIDEEIKIIIHDILCHTREMLKFLRSIKTGKYNAYLDDLIDYALCTEEDIQTIEHYIFELEIKLYNALNGGENIEKLLKAGFKFYEIADKIQKHKTTISKEVKRYRT